MPNWPLALMQPACVAIIYEVFWLMALSNNFAALAALDDAVVWPGRAGLFVCRGLVGVASSLAAPCRCRGGVGRG